MSILFEFGFTLKSQALAIQVFFYEKKKLFFFFLCTNKLSQIPEEIFANVFADKGAIRNTLAHFFSSI